MPSSGDGTGYDETLPTNSGLVSATGLEIRDLRIGVRKRLEKEHLKPADATVGGEHLPGSAAPFFQTSFPTKRPDTTTDLNSADGGRLMVKSDTETLYYWNPVSTTFEPVQLAGDDVDDGSITAAKLQADAGYKIVSYAVVVDQKADTSNGGTFTSGAWQTRALNTTTTDNNSIVTSLSSNTVTLPAGRYRLRAVCPGYKVDTHQCRLRDVTNSVTLAYGNVSRSSSANDSVTASEATAEVVLSGSTEITVEHRCGTTHTGDGFGVAGSFGGVEVYTRLEIWKLI